MVSTAPKHEAAAEGYRQQRRRRRATHPPRRSRHPAPLPQGANRGPCACCLRRFYHTLHSPAATLRKNRSPRSHLQQQRRQQKSGVKGAPLAPPRSTSNTARQRKLGATEPQVAAAAQHTCTAGAQQRSSTALIRPQAPAGPGCPETHPLWVLKNTTQETTAAHAPNRGGGVSGVQLSSSSTCHPVLQAYQFSRLKRA